MKSSITKVLLAATVLSTLTYSPVGVLAAPTAPAKSVKPDKKVFPLIHPTVVPDGVADSAVKYAFLRTPEGGIDAVEVETGKSKWTTKALAKPLIVIANRFVVPYPAHLIVQVPVAGQENALKIGIWESSTGRQIILSHAVVFPEWVVVAAEDGMIYGKHFVSAVTSQGNELSFKWQASTHYAGGAAPPREVEEAARNNGSGIFRVNLKTGRVKSEPLPTAGAEGDEKPEGAEAKDRVEAVVSDARIGVEIAVVLGTKEFRVVNPPVQGDQPMWGTTERELNVVEIATGKILWKRTLKPRQIMPLPA